MVAMAIHPNNYDCPILGEWLGCCQLKTAGDIEMLELMIGFIAGVVSCLGVLRWAAGSVEERPVSHRRQGVPYPH
jgi:hypothetical protein